MTLVSELQHYLKRYIDNEKLAEIILLAWILKYCILNNYQFFSFLLYH